MCRGVSDVKGYDVRLRVHVRAHVCVCLHTFMFMLHEKAVVCVCTMMFVCA